MTSNTIDHCTFRNSLVPGDDEAIREIVRSTGFFYDDEVDIAVELAVERMEKGPASGYHFVVAEIGGQVVGYTCYGPVAGTGASFDFYWMAVRKEIQGKGLGKRLMAETEKGAAAMGGRRLYIETSSRPQYEHTRSLYVRCNYRQEAVLEDFYYPGDSKVFFVKVLEPLS